MHVNEIKEFIEKNASLICEYINTEILKDIAVLNPNYFTKSIQEICLKKELLQIDTEQTNQNILPYLILTLLGDKGKSDYTSLRVETIDFSQINKEASTYYNYAQFSLKDDAFFIELMQCKIGGMPIDEDIVKFRKSVPLKHSGLEEFILKHKKLVSKG